MICSRSRRAGSKQEATMLVNGGWFHFILVLEFIVLWLYSWLRGRTSLEIIGRWNNFVYTTVVLSLKLPPGGGADSLLYNKAADAVGSD